MVIAMLDAAMHRRGGFVLSLDFELMWGVHGSRTIAGYGANILGVRTVVPRMLDLLQRFGLGCTWATVGMLFFDDRDALMAALPAVRPRYRDGRLSSYNYMHEVGRNERTDPYHFGRSLIRRIAEVPRQEIATHTFSHYYCLEDGHTAQAFAADLDAACAAAAGEKLRLRSIVFPRNQINADVLPICRAAGLSVYRGNRSGFIDQPAARSGEGPVRRGLRLADSYLPIPRFPAAPDGGTIHGMTNVPASLFLRPYSHRLAAAEGLKRSRILRAMRHAAERGDFFHLWFHPHNFGRDQSENFALMTDIALEAVALDARYGWPSLTMAEAADRILGRASEPPAPAPGAEGGGRVRSVRHGT